MTRRLAGQIDSRPRSQDSTKRLILETALALFSRHGIDGVSLSQLREASGQNNRSAVHYHFGNKEGLLRAVTGHVNRRLDPLIWHSLQNCRQLSQRGCLSLEDLVKSLSYPFSTLFYLDSEGRDCIRFLSQLSHETDPEKLGLLIESLQDLTEGMLEFLKGLLPGKAQQEYAVLLFLSITQQIEAMSVSVWLSPDSVEALRHPSGQTHDDAQVQTLAMKFCCGGLAAAGS